ncbi:MAG: hypothetical protein WCD76_03360, partial [Pyrinomonadaceae bacterium]
MIEKGGAEVSPFSRLNERTPRASHATGTSPSVLKGELNMLLAKRLLLCVLCATCLTTAAAAVA